MTLQLRGRLEGTRVHKLYRYAVSPEYRYVRRVANEVLAKVPRADFDEVRRKYLVEDPGIEGSLIVHTGTRKYLDAQHWIENAVERAVAVELQRRQPISILDLGCGVPYFLVVARHFGHQGVGLDLNENRMFNDLTKLFAVNRFEHRIVPFEPLPDFRQKFDLITSYMCYFNFYFSEGRARAWRVDEWSYFFEDIRKRLNPGGHLRLELNRGGFYLPPDERGVYLTDETAAGLRAIPGVFVSETRSLIRLVI